MAIKIRVEYTTPDEWWLVYNRLKDLPISSVTKERRSPNTNTIKYVNRRIFLNDAAASAACKHEKYDVK